MTASTAKSGAHRLMRDLLPTYKELWEPSASGSGAQRSDAYGDWYAPQIHSFLPGTWVISGHHQGLEEINKLLEAVRQIRGDSTSQVSECELVLVAGANTDPTGAVILRRG